MPQRDVMVCDRHGCQAEKLTERVIVAEARVAELEAAFDAHIIPMAAPIGLIRVTAPEDSDIRQWGDELSGLIKGARSAYYAAFQDAAKGKGAD
jgi:hypothetical protein